MYGSMYHLTFEELLIKSETNSYLCIIPGDFEGPFSVCALRDFRVLKDPLF
jgi:hypothetical protein